MTQTEHVLDWLRHIGPLTGRQALLDLGIYRLAARVQELRDEGHPIRTQMVRTKTGKRHAVYTLQGEPSAQR